MAEPQRITAWSYSRWGTYTDCPLKAKYKFIDKLPEPGSPAMDRGSAIHKMAEDYVNAPAKPAPKLPDELKLVKAELNMARKGNPKCEQEWCFDSEWEPTGWFAKNAWCRVKTDLVFGRKDEVVIVDHKTGKRKDEHLNQLSLYALGAFIQYPVIEKVSTEVWYIDHGAPHAQASYERNELEDIKAAWMEKTRPMLSDTQFAPRPGNGCRWCHFRKGNGGPCQY